MQHPLPETRRANRWLNTLLLVVILGGLGYFTVTKMHPIETTVTLHTGEQLPEAIVNNYGRGMTIERLDDKTVELSSPKTGTETIPARVGDGFAFTGKEDNMSVKVTRRTSGTITLTFVRVPRVGP